jgi:transketolase
MDTRLGIEDVRASLARMTGDEKHDESSTSTLDALWVLYDQVLRVDPADPKDPNRDRFILSKGHGPAAYYAVLATKGFFPEEYLDGFLTWASPLGSHPDRRQVPGVEASTGSLGHGLPLGVGVALALRAKGKADRRVVVLCGDAELNEGSNWESILLAPTLHLAALTLLVVDNHSSSIPMGSWPERLGAFGWDVAVVGGHDRRALATALAARPGRPNAVIADIPEGEW